MAIRKIVSRSIGTDVIVAEDLANNSVTAAEITDGAVTTNKLGNAAVTGEKIGDTEVTAGKLASTLDLSSNTVTLPDESVTADKLDVGQIGGRRNLIINGAMQVAQRSTSEVTGAGFGTVDRMKASASNDSGIRQQQIALTSSDTPYASGFRSSYRMKVATADTTASSRYASVLYFIEAQDLANSGWDYTSSDSNITLSFWAKSTLAGTYYLRFGTHDNASYYYGVPYTLEADTWKKVTVTISGNSNLVVDNDNGKGATIEFVLEYGTNYTDSTFADSTWTAYSGSNRTDDFAQSWRGTEDATFEITGVQLEVGSVATPFEHRSYGEELALCQRYFYKSYDDGVAPGTVTEVGAYYRTVDDGSPLYASVGPIRYPVTMRDSPTVTFYAPGTGTSARITLSGDKSVVLRASGRNGVGFYVNGDNTGVNAGSSIIVHLTAEDEL